MIITTKNCTESIRTSLTCKARRRWSPRPPSGAWAVWRSTARLHSPSAVPPSRPCQARGGGPSGSSWPRPTPPSGPALRPVWCPPPTWPRRPTRCPPGRNRTPTPRSTASSAWPWPGGGRGAVRDEEVPMLLHLLLLLPVLPLLLLEMLLWLLVSLINVNVYDGSANHKCKYHLVLPSILVIFIQLLLPLSVSQSPLPSLHRVLIPLPQIAARMPLE